MPNISINNSHRLPVRHIKCLKRKEIVRYISSGQLLSMNNVKIKGFNLPLDTFSKKSSILTNTLKLYCNKMGILYRWHKDTTSKFGGWYEFPLKEMRKLFDF